MADTYKPNDRDGMTSDDIRRNKGKEGGETNPDRSDVRDGTGYDTTPDTGRVGGATVPENEDDLDFTPNFDRDSDLL